MELISPLIASISSHFSSYLIGLLVILVVSWFGTRKRRLLEATFPGMPGPKPLPFIANATDLIKVKGQIHIFFDRYYKKYGNLFSKTIFGEPGLVISDPEMLREILVKNFECFHDRTTKFSFPEPVDTVLSLVRGETWRKIRNTLTPTFSAHKLKTMVPFMNVACDTLMKKVHEVAEVGGSFDIVRYQQALTMDIIMSTAFGIQSDYQFNPEDPVMQMALRAMKPSAFMQFVGNVLIPLLPFGQQFISSKVGSKIFFKDMIDLSGIAQDVVDIKRKGQSTRKDFLDLMLNATNPDTADQKKLTDNEVTAQCVIFLLAGYETSSTTLSMACYHLATNPRVQEKLQQEVDSVWSDKDAIPSYDTVHELPYLDMVLSETLRLCPPGFNLMRVCTKECVVKGLKIPQNTQIVVPVYSMHMDPKLYPDPERFDPERFNAEAKQSRDPYTYLPFGLGPRNCVGMRFAQMEMKLVLARLLKRYSFVVTPETKIPPTIEAKAALTVTGGITLGVRKRDEGL